MLLVPLPRAALSFALPQDLAFTWTAQPAPEPPAQPPTLPALDQLVAPAAVPAIALPAEAAEPQPGPVLASTARPESSPLPVALPPLPLPPASDTQPVMELPPPGLGGATLPPPLTAALLEVGPPPVPLPAGLALPALPLPAAPPALPSLPLFTPPPPVTGPADPAMLLAALGVESVLADWVAIPQPPLLAWPML